MLGLLRSTAALPGLFKSKTARKHFSAPSLLMPPYYNSALDDLSRPVYCICSIPVDAVSTVEAARNIKSAATKGVPFLLSTPNVNFLATSLRDPEFRESLLQSDLCTADGMPIVWIARLLGIPIKKRTAGSDIFEALKSDLCREPPLKVFFFGATEESASAAARELNDAASSVRCVGFICPGFGAVDEISAAEFINTINLSDADFLVAALGAQKGQAWLMRNHDALRVPVRAHLGATIHFQAGTIKRSPPCIRRSGMEWLWRIWAEPKLWRRYYNDGLILLHLLLTKVLPLAIEVRQLRIPGTNNSHKLVFLQIESGNEITLMLSGFAVAGQLGKLIPILADALMAKRRIIIDLSMINAVDARFLGLLLVLRKQARRRRVQLELVGHSPKLVKTFRLHCAEDLLEPSYDAPAAASG